MNLHFFHAQSPFDRSPRMLERLDFADSEIRSGELQVWVPNCPFLHVAFIIRRNMNSSDAEYCLFIKFCSVSECTHLHIREHPNDCCFVFAFYVGHVGGVVAQQLEPVLDQHTGSTSRRGKPLSAGKDKLLAQATKERKKGKNSQLIVLPSRPTPYCAALPGWERLSRHCNSGQQRQQHHNYRASCIS